MKPRGSYIAFWFCSEEVFCDHHQSGGRDMRPIERQGGYTYADGTCIDADNLLGD